MVKLLIHSHLSEPIHSHFTTTITLPVETKIEKPRKKKQKNAFNFVAPTTDSYLQHYTPLLVRTQTNFVIFTQSKTSLTTVAELQRETNKRMSCDSLLCVIRHCLSCQGFRK